MLALIIVAGGLYRIAKKKEMNAILWGIIGVVAWFGGQFIGGMLLGLINPSGLYEEGTIMIWGIGGAIGASIIAFVALEIISKNNLKSNDDIMDDSSFDDE